MTTPTPAQADEKALADRATRMIEALEDQYGGIQIEDPVHGKFTVGSCVRELVAAIRPEGEAVAIGWVDETDLAVLTRIKGQTGACRITAIRAVPAPGDQPLFASPPAPAGVKVRPLEWLECKALSGFTKLIGRDCFGNEFVRLDIRNQTRAEIDEFKRAQQADYEARILSAILPPEEAQAGSPAEALPSQTSGAEAGVRTGAEMIARHRFRLADDGNCAEIDSNGLAEEIDAALTKPASEPAGGGVREAGIAFADQVEVLLSADTDMPTYQQDYDDTEAALETFRAALSSPASSPAEAEALPAGVDAAAICERQALQYLNGEPPTATGRMYQRACRDCAEAIRAAALSPAPAQAGSFVASASDRPEPSQGDA